MVRLLADLKVPMRDGPRLSADVYLPEGAGPWPTVLIRTPYDNNTSQLIERARRLAGLGFACALQDCRGRFDSEGFYEPFRNEALDGDDTLSWIGRQAWSNGEAGMVGGSYTGWVQWAAAPHQNPVLRCISPRAIATDLYAGLHYPGGALQLNILMTWGMRTSGRTMQSIDYDDWREAFRSLPLWDADRAAGRDLPFWRDWLAHPARDDYWAPLRIDGDFGQVVTPALITSGWYDPFSSQAFSSFNGLRERGGSPEARQSRVIVGPWAHAPITSSRTGAVDFGPASMIDVEAEEVRWLDHWLRGRGTNVTEPPVRIFVMGENVWRNEQTWPLERTDWQAWYFHSSGRANTLLGDGALGPGLPGDEPPDKFTYHPEHPVPTVGGNTCCSPHIVAWGPYDQRDVEMRSDVLCFSSAPLAQDLEVTGPIRVVLFAATDGVDTDWTAKLVDVRPTGFAINLCDGILRARYRDGMVDPQPVEPGAIHRYEIDLMVTSNVFKSGHRIRVEISSSNFPRFDRNLNTGGTATDVDLRPARQTVWHSAAYPSHILLPVISAAGFRP